MPRLLSPVAPGQTITADWANELLAEVRRLQRLAAGPGIHLLQNEAGCQIALADPQRLWLFQNYEFNSGGQTDDGIRFWQAVRLRPNASGSYEREVEQTFTLYDPLGVSTQFASDGAAPQDARHWATFNAYSGRWEIVGARTAQRYAVLTSNWRYADPSGFSRWSLLANPCLDAVGTGVDATQSLQIDLPQVGFGHPNLVAGEIVNYQEASDGTLYCTSAYIDDPITTLKPFTNIGARIHGWALANGSDNSAENGGTGIDLTDKFIRGSGFGSSGGSDTHTHDDHGPADTTDESAHTHAITSATNAIGGGGASTVVTSVTTPTGPGSAHHHQTPTLAHSGADNVPAWTGVTWWERINNGAMAS